MGSTPTTDNNWKITPNADPELFNQDQNDLRWQQQQKDREI